METHELCAMHIHSEPMENMGTTKKQVVLIKAFDEYGGDIEEMITELQLMNLDYVFHTTKNAEREMTHTHGTVTATKTMIAKIKLHFF